MSTPPRFLYLYRSLREGGYMDDLHIHYEVCWVHEEASNAVGQFLSENGVRQSDQRARGLTRGKLTPKRPHNLRFARFRGDDLAFHMKMKFACVYPRLTDYWLDRQLDVENAEEAKLIRRVKEKRRILGLECAASCPSLGMNFDFVEEEDVSYFIVREDKTVDNSAYVLATKKMENPVASLVEAREILLKPEHGVGLDAEYLVSVIPNRHDYIKEIDGTLDNRLDRLLNMR